MMMICYSCKPPSSGTSFNATHWHDSAESSLTACNCGTAEMLRLRSVNLSNSRAYNHDRPQHNRIRISSVIVLRRIDAVLRPDSWQTRRHCWSYVNDIINLVRPCEHIAVLDRAGGRSILVVIRNRRGGPDTDRHRLPRASPDR